MAVTEVADRALGVLWGKSNAAGRVHLLLAHLLDTAAVAELMWEGFLAPSVREALDHCSGGCGKDLFVLMCGWHDLGKASPAFQSKVPELGDRVRAVGLTWVGSDQVWAKWHHTLAGVRVLRQTLVEAGCSRETIGWLWPLIGGHHGVVPAARKWDAVPGNGDAQGLGLWREVQQVLALRVASEVGIRHEFLAAVARPRRAVQLTLSGAIIMADWIASNDESFPGVDQIVEVTMAAARRRAHVAWGRLGLRGGWSPRALPMLADPVRARFGFPARGVQAEVVRLVERAPSPGLIIVEAPMGEGKTEAALAAVEVLARRFGQDGLFVGMPTQATSDPMFARVGEWVQEVDGDVPVGLLHGKRRFNRDWKRAVERLRFRGVGEGACRDEYGVPDDDYGASDTPSGVGGGDDEGVMAPAEWFQGNKRGLLAPVTVGTIDQLLHAATRTRHVMLRQAGLAGRVVVLDEVHAYDVYMSQFLFEALRWLADARVPVVLLSATLPPAMRADLVRAYVQGGVQRASVDVELPDPGGYPNVLAVHPDAEGGESVILTGSAEPWRLSIPVDVQILGELEAREGVSAVVDLLRGSLAGGGCALVVRNTVGRAQQTYRALRDVFGPEVVLLHARLTAGERADRTDRVLDLLGKPGRTGGAVRPARLIVVATQLAEQSFDVDVDLLISDLAPIDLLLQRIGRLHRHDRPSTERPAALRTPRVVVTGMALNEPGPPSLPYGSVIVYGEHLLLRAAALVARAAGACWSMPAQVPQLVADGYGGDVLVPDGWAEAATKAEEAWRQEQARRAEHAQGFLLAGEKGLGTQTLSGLHVGSTSDLPDEAAVAAVVRDGAPSVEVVLVRRNDSGYLSLDGHPLGPSGERVSDVAVLERVVQDTVRLPAREALTAAAERELRPLPGWGIDPWLRRVKALDLGNHGTASLGGYRFSYDHDLGLIDEREGGR